MVPSTKDLIAIAPQLVVAVFGMVVLLMDAIWPKIGKRVLANVSVLGLVIAGIVSWVVVPKGEVRPAMQGMVMADGYTAFFNTIAVLSAVLACWLSVSYLERGERKEGEYFALIMFTTVGAMVMATSINLICIFIGLEILSIALYILSGFQTERLESDESALKYFLLGSFASAFLLYGIALVYGATNSIDLQQIGNAIRDAGAAGTDPGKNYLLLAGLAMMLVGFGFKVAVVPFHVWTPDVYEGAPTTITAFMSVTAKAAGFAAFLRFVAVSITDSGLQLQVSAILASIAALTMLVGNVVAVVQPNIKRMLAYSSIAHAGYILCGLVAAVRPGGLSALGLPGDTKTNAISAVLFYTLAYAVSNLGAFGVVLALRKKGEEIQNVEDLAGVGYRYPWLGALMALFLLSLAGLPPTVGFFGKLFLINALVGMSGQLVWLIVLFVLTSAVSFYYYLGVVRSMYMDKTGADAGEGTQFSGDWHLRLALGISAIGTIVFGLWSSGALDVATRVAQGLTGGGGPLAMR